MADFFGQVPNAEFLSIFDTHAYMDKGYYELYKEYQDRLHCFYASVFALINKTPGLLKATDRIQGAFALFQHIEESEDGPVLCMARKDALVIVRTKLKKHKYPYVRIMTNEAYTCDDGIDYLVTDVTVDYDGNSQLYVGSFPVRENTQTPSTAPIFAIDHEIGGVRVMNDAPDTYTSLILGFDTYEGGTITPYGHFSNMADSLYALDTATQQLKDISKFSPLLTSVDT